MVNFAKEILKAQANFMEHYKTNHPILVAAVERYKKSKNDDDSKIIMTQSTIPSKFALSPRIVSLHFDYSI